MAGRDPLDKLADIGALEAEAAKVIAIVEQISSTIKSVPELALKYKRSSGGDELKQNTEELITANKKLLSQQELLDAELKKAGDLQSDVAKRIAQVRVENQARNKEITAEAREAAGLNDAYKKLELQYNAAQRAAKNLAATPGTPQGAIDEANAKAQALSNQLKTIDAAVGQHQRKVGDYIGAVSTLKEGLGDIKNKMDQMTQAGEQNSAVYQQLQREYEILGQLVTQQSAGFASVTQEIRAQEKALQSLRSAGLEDSDMFRKLQHEVAEARKEFNDFQKQQKILSSDVPALSAMSLAVKGLAGGYAISAGAAALFGDEEGKIEKETRKLVAIMTIMQGLNEAHELIEQRKAVAIALSTVATRIATLAQKAWTSTILQSTASTIGFRIALVSLTGGLLLLLPLMASGFTLISEKIKDAHREEEALNEVNKKAIEGYAEEQVHIKMVVKELQDENFSRKQKKDLIDELQKKYPEILGNIKNEGEYTGDLAKAINDKLIPALELEAKAKAAQELATEKYKKILEIQNGKIEESAGLISKIIIGLGQTNNASLITFYGMQRGVEDAQEKVKELQKDMDALFKISIDAQDQLNKKGKGPTDNRAKDAFIDISKEIEARAKLIEMIKQEQAELIKPFAEGKELPERARAEALTKVFGLEKQLIEDRNRIALQLNAIQLQAERKKLADEIEAKKGNQKEINELQAQSAVTQAALEYDRKAIVQKNNDDLFKAQVEYSLKLGQIRADAIQKEKDDEKQFSDEMLAIDAAYAKAKQDIITKSAENIKNVTNETRDYELSALDRRFAKEFSKKHLSDQQKLELEKKYQEERKRIMDEAAIHVLEAQVKEKESEKELAKQRNTRLPKGQQIDVQKIDTDIANLKVQINDKKNERIIESDKIASEKKKKIQDAELKVAEKAADTLEEFVKGGFEREINNLQVQIEQNNKLKDAETQRISSSTLNEQQKAAQLAILQAQTQAKNDDLQRRQNEEKLREARFERDAAILKITANTLISASKAGWVTPEAIAIEAVGALEIATLLAKSLPKFAEGTDYGHKGPMIWGEKGTELMITPSGKTEFSPATASLGFIPETGTKIIPHDELNRMLFNMMIRSTANMMAPVTSMTKVEKKLDKIASALQAQSQQNAEQTKQLIRAYTRSRPIFIPSQRDFTNDYLP